MTITSEILGKIGKMDSEKVEGVASGGSGSTALMKTIKIPPGETWLVSVVGEMFAYSTSPNLAPFLIVGESSAIVYGDVGLSSVETGQVDISIKRNFLTSEDRFVGELYTMKL